MAKYLKMLLLLIFVTAPTLDIAFLDNQESADHFSEAYHDEVDQNKDAATDLHCICHVIHNGFAFGKVTAHVVAALRGVRWSFADNVLQGLHPKPGLHPPSFQLS